MDKTDMISFLFDFDLAAPGQVYIGKIINIGRFLVDLFKQFLSGFH